MKISVWGLLGPRWNPHNSEIGLYIQKGQTKRAAPCLKIYPNFRGYGRQITYEPWHSGMSRIRHHIPDENWPTCQNQLILFHISYLQLSSLSQFVPIPHGWLWILKILPGSLFHAKFFARPSPPSPSLGFCTAGSCLEYPLHMPNLSDLSLSWRSSLTTLPFGFTISDPCFPSEHSLQPAPNYLSDFLFGLGWFSLVSLPIRIRIPWGQGLGLSYSSLYHQHVAN